MPRTPLYPLRFEPIFKRMPWGGGRLPEFLRTHAAPDPENPHPVGEAWVLSDVAGSESVVTNGPLAGTTLRDLIATDPQHVLGEARPQLGRFPLLLKFIDARQELSVQVHPNDEQAARHSPGKAGKTEAWVILDADPAASRIYAGFHEGVTAADFCAALATKTVPQTLHSFTPKPGDAVFLDAGTVHAIGAGILLFEVQQTSDITYRLYDWDRGRELHIEKGLECANFAAGPKHPLHFPTERFLGCPYFSVHHHTSSGVFFAGYPSKCRAVVCVGGRGELVSNDLRYPIRTGDVYLLPAGVPGLCDPDGEITLIECGLPA